MKRYKQIAALGVVLCCASGMYAMGQAMKKVESTNDLSQPEHKVVGLRRVCSEMPKAQEYPFLVRFRKKEQEQKEAFKLRLPAALKAVVADPELEETGSQSPESQQE